MEQSNDSPDEFDRETFPKQSLVNFQMNLRTNLDRGTIENRELKTASRNDQTKQDFRLSCHASNGPFAHL